MGPQSARALPTDLMLPRDFDIFSPCMVTIPTCIHMRANSPPVRDSDWAISFSWWGKIRSRPPPCMSSLSPRCLMLIAEHSMCQPGRPRPHGLSHDGSPSSNFHSAKSSGSRFAASTSIRAPDLSSSTLFFESMPYRPKLDTAK